jgi:hypothetical protein
MTLWGAIVAPTRVSGGIHCFDSSLKAEQRVTLYLLSGPQTNRIGLFHFSVATATEDLDLGADTLRRALAKVSATFGWMFDADRGSSTCRLGGGGTTPITTRF